MGKKKIWRGSSIWLTASGVEGGVFVSESNVREVEEWFNMLHAVVAIVSRKPLATETSSCQVKYNHQALRCPDRRSCEHLGVIPMDQFLKHLLTMKCTDKKLGFLIVLRGLQREDSIAERGKKSMN